MIALLIPSHETEADALDWVEAHGVIVRVVLMRGFDGKVRGNALVRLRS